MKMKVMECLYAWRWGGMVVLPIPVLWFLLRVNIEREIQLTWANHEVGIEHYMGKVEVIV